MGVPLSPSELWLLETIGWLFYSSQIWRRAAGLWLKAWERGRGARVGNGLVEGGDTVVICVSHHRAPLHQPPPPGLIPSHARPGVIPLLPVVNYFQSKCETIKQTEGQSLLVRSKERALQRYLAAALSPPSLLLLHSSLWALKQCPDPGWAVGAPSGAWCRLGFGSPRNLKASQGDAACLAPSRQSRGQAGPSARFKSK